MRLLVCLLVGIVSLPSLRAQGTLPLSTDRPGVSTAPGVIPPGVFQFENGFEYYRSRSLRAYQLPALLFRTGVTRVAELRLGIGLTRRDSLRSGDEVHTGWNTSSLSAGAKVHLCKQRRWLPEMALVVNLLLPYTAQTELESAYVGHNLLLVTSHELTPVLSLVNNLGSDWEGNRTGATLTYTTCLSAKITTRTGCFLEHYGRWEEKASLSPGVDAGIFYLFTPSLQVDLSGGTTRANGVADYFIATGLSFKLHTRRRVSPGKEALLAPAGQVPARTPTIPGGVPR